MQKEQTIPSIPYDIYESPQEIVVVMPVLGAVRLPAELQADRMELVDGHTGVVLPLEKIVGLQHFTPLVAAAQEVGGAGKIAVVLVLFLVCGQGRNRRDHNGQAKDPPGQATRVSDRRENGFHE